MKYLGPPQGGSVANQTWARNTFGQYVRVRAGRGGTGYAGFATIAQAWSTVLTDDQREIWQEFALSQRVKQRGFDRQNLTGFNAFMRCNLCVAQGGGVILQVVPPDGIPGQVWGYASNLTAAGASGVITFDWSTSGTTGTFELYSSGVVTAGTMSPPGRGKYWKRFWSFGWLIPGGGPPGTDLGQWATVFGAPSPGDWTWIEARQMSPASCYAGSFLRVRFQWT